MLYLLTVSNKFTFGCFCVLSWPVPGGEAAGNSRGGEKSQSGSDQQQQAPDARRLQEDPAGTDGQGGQRSTWQRPEEEGRRRR